MTLSIKDMHAVARSKGGKCLSTKYSGVLNKLRWQCKEGHVWESKPRNVRNGCWCPVCSRGEVYGVKISIKDMQELAMSRSGECLSDKYINSTTKLRWQCKEGHEWEARPSSIKKGSWCPKCYGRVLTIQDMHDLALSRRGKCLSEEYLGSRTDLAWRCEDGHTWFAKPVYVKSGTWCPECARIKRENARWVKLFNQSNVQKESKNGGV